MKKLTTIARQFRDDENGAAMVEYTILIGLITALVVASVIAIGTWAGTKWTELETAIGA